ncbi:hypothetical protein Pcinc_010326 [Petrolisthes cinctipes]|uniref:Uncharacterized protein n=1 Tax=Petrolisthes cinctipes TaxID=88211 RepID=A0AAE1G994_PETCI|nr:hypothetical protein Pcinc_010326 [Petrolisthes cinctipes]
MNNSSRYSCVFIATCAFPKPENATVKKKMWLSRASGVIHLSQVASREPAGSQGGPSGGVHSREPAYIHGTSWVSVVFIPGARWVTGGVHSRCQVVFLPEGQMVFIPGCQVGAS